MLINAVAGGGGDEGVPAAFFTHGLGSTYSTSSCQWLYSVGDPIQICELWWAEIPREHVYIVGTFFPGGNYLHFNGADLMQRPIEVELTISDTNIHGEPGANHGKKYRAKFWVETRESMGGYQHYLFGQVLESEATNDGITAQANVTCFTEIVSAN